MSGMEYDPDECMPSRYSRPKRVSEFSKGTLLMKLGNDEDIYMAVDSTFIVFKLTGDVGMKVVMSNERFYEVTGRLSLN